MTSRNIDAGEGLTIHLEMSGSGSPLILLHGFTGSTKMWDPFREQLEQSFTVIAVDLPGHGRSSAPMNPDRYGLIRFASDLARVQDTLGLDRAAMLGYSMGGRAALRFALTHGDRVTALILESTSSGIRDENLRASRAQADDALADRIEKEGLENFVDYWESLPLWESQRALPEVTRRRLREERLANDPDGLANSLRGASAGLDIISDDALSRLQAPTLLIAGALDAAYVEHARILAAAIPDATVTEIPGAGHAVHLERPQEFIDAVDRFV